MTYLLTRSHTCLPETDWHLIIRESPEFIRGECQSCNGGYVKSNVLLRADQLVDLCESDEKHLIDKGLRYVVDLRKSSETINFPSAFIDSNEVEVHNIIAPTYKNKQSVKLNDSCMGEEYIRKIDSFGEYYVGVIKSIIEFDGMAAIHCIAGKDRTGIIIALIHLLLGVRKDDILSDYEISEVYLEENIKRFLALNPNIPRYLISSNRENMIMLIDYIEMKYESTYNYLKIHGFNETDLIKLREKFVCDKMI